MNANVPLELVAEKIGECVDFVRINLQQGTLLIDGLPIGYAYKKREENKNYSYVVDPIRFTKYLKQLEEANKILYGKGEQKMKLRKTLLWYGIFVVALILNQTKSFKEDIIVTVVVYSLWIILTAVTYMYFKETKWE